MSTVGPPVMGAPAAGMPATAGPPRPPRSALEAPQATRPPRPHSSPLVHLHCDVRGEITPQAPPTGECRPLAARRDTPGYRDLSGRRCAARAWPQPALAVEAGRRELHRGGPL